MLCAAHLGCLKSPHNLKVKASPYLKLPAASSAPGPSMDEAPLVENTHRSSKTKGKSRPGDVQNRFNRGADLPKSRPRPSKIEAWKLQNQARSPLGRVRTVGGQWGAGRNAEKYAKMRNLALRWKPKRLQNRGSNPKKATLRHSTCSASILQWLERSFGKVLGRFFGGEVRAESKKMHCGKSQQNIGWAHKF